MFAKMGGSDIDWQFRYPLYLDCGLSQYVVTSSCTSMVTCMLKQQYPSSTGRANELARTQDTRKDAVKVGTSLANFTPSPTELQEKTRGDAVRISSRRFRSLSEFHIFDSSPVCRRTCIIQIQTLSPISATVSAPRNTRRRQAMVWNPASIPNPVLLPILRCDPARRMVSAEMGNSSFGRDRAKDGLTDVQELPLGTRQ